MRFFNCWQALGIEGTDLGHKCAWHAKSFTFKILTGVIKGCLRPCLEADNFEFFFLSCIPLAVSTLCTPIWRQKKIDSQLHHLLSNHQAHFKESVCLTIIDFITGYGMICVVMRKMKEGSILWSELLPCLSSCTVVMICMLLVGKSNHSFIGLPIH